MKYIEDLCKRRENLKPLKKDISEAFEVIKSCFKNGNKVLICGNGGSAADSAHITGELMKGFKNKRTVSDKFSEKLRDALEDLEGSDSLANAHDKHREMVDCLEQGLPTIDLTAMVGLNTAFINDKDANYMYANEVLGLGNEGDVLIAISTSGNSKNVLNACYVAKAKKMKVVALTGKDGGKLKQIADTSIVVPMNETYLIQEEHIAIYHALCLDLEEEFF